MRAADPDRATLLCALAEATPAYARKPIEVSPDMSPSQRTILALAELTPAFVPDFDQPTSTFKRPWYRHPVTLILALGVLLGIPATALATLPHSPGSITDRTPTTARVTTSVAVPPTTTTPATKHATLTAISIDPSEVTRTAGQSRQLTAIGTYTDGSTSQVIGPVEWTSTDSNVADVTSAGLVTAHDNRSPGRATVRASSGGLSASATVIVTTAAPPSTTTVTAMETTTVTTTIATPTVTTTVPTTETTTVTTTVAGPPLVQTNCSDGSTVTSPQACPAPPPPRVH